MCYNNLTKLRKGLDKNREGAYNTIMTDRPLTNKQQAFCREYVKDSNGTQAAMRAGYSENGAKVRGSELLTISNVMREIRRLLAELVQEMGITVESVHKLYSDAYVSAKTLSQPSAMVSAATGIARLGGLDKDSQAKQDTPEELTQSEMEQAQAEAQAAIRLKITRSA